MTHILAWLGLLAPKAMPDVDVGRIPTGPYLGAVHGPHEHCDCPNPGPGRPWHCAANPVHTRVCRDGR